MEATGQTMGLDETLDGLNSTQENGIDVHMILPKEYGAIVILSASGYGNPGKLLDEADIQKRTTTGNSSGVYFTGDRWEMIAGTSAIETSKYQEGFTYGYIPIGWHGSPEKDQGGMNGPGYPHVASVGGVGLFSKCTARGVVPPHPWGHHDSYGDIFLISRGICVSL